jgi:hypothetical protein
MILNIRSVTFEPKACPGCGKWPDLAHEFGGGRWCGPCVPWSRVPCPLGSQIDFGAGVLARLEREGLRAAHGDAARLVAWLEAAAEAWPGDDPWRTLRLAARVRGRLEKLAWWCPPGAHLASGPSVISPPVPARGRPSLHAARRPGSS